MIICRRAAPDDLHEPPRTGTCIKIQYNCINIHAVMSTPTRESPWLQTRCKVGYFPLIGTGNGTNRPTQLIGVPLAGAPETVTSVPATDRFVPSSWIAA